MQLGPDPGTRSPRQQAYGLAAITERQNKQPCPAILAGLRIAHHRTTAVIDLRLFCWCGEDDARCFRTLWSAKLPDKALHRLIATAKAVVRHQVLPNRFGIAALSEALFDQLAVLFADTCRGTGGLLKAPGFGEKGAIKSGLTMAGFAPESGVTCMAGFAGARRPHPGRHTTTPAVFR